MKYFIFVLFVVACANADSYFRDSFLRTSGTTITDANASCKFGTPPAAYETLFADDKVATDRIVQGINKLKRFFHVGLHPIPVLDPFKKDVMGPFNIDNSLIRGQITLRNVVITGLKGMKIDELVMRLHYDEQFRLDTNFTIPLLEFSAELETNVRIRNKKIISIKVKGGISLTLNDLKITGAAGGRPVTHHDGRTTLVIDSVHGCGRAAFALVNLILNTAVQKIIESLGVKMIYKAGRDEIGTAIGEMFIKEGNEVLTRLTLDQVQAYLLGDE